jgi:hypothetical protein
MAASRASHAPTGDCVAHKRCARHRSTVGASWLACDSSRAGNNDVESDGLIAGKPRSHRGWCRAQTLRSTPFNCGSCLACDSGRAGNNNVESDDLIAGKPRSHRGWCRARTVRSTPFNCGSWLACDSGRAGNNDVESGGLIAGKPRSHRGWCRAQSLCSTPSRRSTALVAALCKLAVIQHFLCAAGVQVRHPRIDDPAMAAAVIYR